MTADAEEPDDVPMPASDKLDRALGSTVTIPFPMTPAEQDRAHHISGVDSAAEAASSAAVSDDGRINGELPDGRRDG